MAGEQYPSAFAGLVGWIDSQRQAARAKEDADLDKKIALIHDMISGPGANPARTAEGISNILELQGQKGGRGKPKKGLAGFMGQDDNALPSMLAGLIHGTIPFEGPTTQTIQHPGFENFGIDPLDPNKLPGEMISPIDGGHMTPNPAGVAKAQGFSGQSVLGSPLQIPPPPFEAPPTGNRMLSAARQMQTTEPVPASQQPIRRTGMEVAHEQSMIKAQQDTDQMQAEFEQAVRMGQQAGLSLQDATAQARMMVMEKYGLKQTNLAKALPGKHVFQQTGPDGKPMLVDAVIQQLPDMTVRAISAATGLPLLPDAQPVNLPSGASASQYSIQRIVRPNGEVTFQYVPKDPNANLNTSNLDTGLTQRVPPPPTYVYNTIGPDGAPIPVAETRADLVARAKKISADAKKAGLPDIAPPVYQKLDANERTFVDNMAPTLQTINRVKAVIEQAGMTKANSVGDLANQRWQQAMYKLGFDPADAKLAQEDLLQQTGYLRALLLKGLMPGRPSQYIASIFEAHTPSEYQTPMRIYETIKLVERELKDRYAGIAKANPGAYVPPVDGAGGGTGAGAKGGLDPAVLDKFLSGLGKGPQP